MPAEPPVQEKGYTRKLFSTAFKDFKELSPERQEARTESMDEVAKERQELKEETQKLKSKSLSAGVRRLFSGESPPDDEEETAKIKKKVKKVKQTSEEVDDHVKISVPEKESEEEEEEMELPTKKEPKKHEQKEEPEERTKEESEEGSEEDVLADLTEQERQELKDLDSTDENDLRKPDGTKVSPASTKDFKKMKKMLKDAYRSLAKARGASKVSPKIVGDYETLRKDFNELKGKYDTAFFQETQEWKDTYQAPVDKANEDMVKWLGSHEHDKDSDELAEMESHINEITKALHAGDEIKYYQEVDEVAGYLKKGAGTRFEQAAPALWKAHMDKVSAFKDKHSARDTVINRFRTVALERAKEVNKLVDASIADFEHNNQIVITAYKTDERFKDYINYDEIVTQKKEHIKKHIENALVNRQVSPELATIINQGILYDLKEKETEGLRTRINIQEETIARLESKLGIKEKTLKKVSPSSRISRDERDEDEDKDAPKSLTELFKQRRNQGLV